MLPKNEVQWDEGKATQQQSKMFQDDRKKFDMKFFIEIWVSSANLKMDRFALLYAPVLFQYSDISQKMVSWNIKL